MHNIARSLDADQLYTHQHKIACAVVLVLPKVSCHANVETHYVLHNGPKMNSGVYPLVADVR